MDKPQTLKKKQISQPGRGQAPFLMMFAGLALIVTAVVMVLTQQSTPEQEISEVRIGQALGNFTLTALDGRTVKLSDYRGKVVLLNIWATWCPPCREEMPDLQTFYAAHKDRGFVVLAINAGDARSDVKLFADSSRLTFPILLDTQVEVIRRMGIFNYPTSILVDRSGNVQNIQIGMYSPSNLAADVTPLLSK